ncbi:DUF4023 domain-containing protein [Paenibacillus psychroresistens]|uniref:DUF4023 domain-containing protein n=1 Tax=Paenibacillus psychroresistens TaxID=1778678 RepID=A0A6B8RDZ4_9BACL|nr:DUF4023 domain-containing protein [Paenibacillus psychroresistens]QGQ93934.1 DUF4023 domain-containing protein [Paenibacillus psychroresistens]
MENTSDYLKKLEDTQEKAEKNKQHQGQGNNSEKLPNKKHSTNK